MMSLSNVLILIVAVFVVGPTTSSADNNLRIGAFNIKAFGIAKMSDPFTADVIRKIVLRYDLILIQEIRDKSGDSLKKLHDMVGRITYGLTVSERLGRTKYYKEQYAYFYRSDRLTLLDTHQYVDQKNVFERSPYCALFQRNGDRGVPFSVIGVHVKPSAAVAEINNLIVVYNDVIRKWGNVPETTVFDAADLLYVGKGSNSVGDVIIMGDLNAGCNYVKERDLESMSIYNRDYFFWPIGFGVDTTTTPTTSCPYDRFVIAGPNIRFNILPLSVGIFRFEIVFALNVKQMVHVSDHYPIEMVIY